MIRTLSSAHKVSRLLKRYGSASLALKIAAIFLKKDDSWSPVVLELQALSRQELRTQREADRRKVKRRSSLCLTNK